MQNSANDDRHDELTVSGSIYLESASGTPIEVRRGMTIVSSDGLEAGFVAAVTTAAIDSGATYIVLGRVCQNLEYRLLPVDLIERVTENQILLRIFGGIVERLPPWHGS